MKLAVTKILHFNLLNNDDIDGYNKQNYYNNRTIISIKIDDEDVGTHQGAVEIEYDQSGSNIGSSSSKDIIKDDKTRNDTDKTLKTETEKEEEFEMAVHLRNKLAQAFGVGNPSTNEDTLNRNGTIASTVVGGTIGGASGDMGLFNISRAKKVELQTLSSRISDAGLTGKYFM